MKRDFKNKFQYCQKYEIMIRIALKIVKDLDNFNSLKNGFLYSKTL
jgi:hypothetical protein